MHHQPELAKKVEAFGISHFGRLQDQIGEKLLPRFAALLGEKCKTVLDALAFADVFFDIIDNTQAEISQLDGHPLNR